MRRVLIVVIAVSTFACAPDVKRVGAPPSATRMAEFWIDPAGERRDLFDGPPSIDRLRPRTDERFEVLERDPRGYSITYKVRDARQRVWNVKIGPEAQTEVVTSRILWALGYHALPSYFVERWVAVEKSKGAVLGGARFRPHDLGLTSQGTWSWQESPFVDTPPYRRLLALMMILNSTDLKNENNELYQVNGPARERASRWYVVKDLGASLGETGRMDPRRGDIDSFEREPFIRGVGTDGVVRFAYRGRHQELLDHIRVEDVRWVCERLQKIPDAQLREAFRAGHFDQDVTARYLARIHQKVDQGLALR